jgi:beta-lactamase superfamily II metal-dependent hydrolase
VAGNSPFGHPHREVVERWSGEGAMVASTADNGMISFSTDGENLDVWAFARQER